MESDFVPRSIARLANRLLRLRNQRREVKREIEHDGSSRRGLLTSSHRKAIFQKTGGRCHICGGKIKRRERWQADHILAFSVGGKHAIENYLPAHKLCNHYRWDYSAEEFQYILKIGVWTRTQIERQSKIGIEVAAGFLSHEMKRAARRKKR